MSLPCMQTPECILTNQHPYVNVFLDNNAVRESLSFGNT